MSTAKKPATKAAKQTKPEPEVSAQRGEQVDDGPVAGEEGIELRSFRVKIVKDAVMSIDVRVPEHEIAILETLHGVDNVEVDEETGKPLTINATAEEEYGRLETRYGRSGQEALQAVYGSPQGLARETGLPSAGGRRRIGSRNASSDVIQSSQRGHVED